MRRTSFLPLIPAAFALLLLSAPGCRRENLPTVRVKNNRIVKSNYDFFYEHWQEPRLRELFLREDFKDLKTDNQFSLFLMGCDWTHRQWESGYPDPYPLCNAIDILDDIRGGRTGGFCGQYAYVLGDVLKSSGFFSVRYVELTREDGDGHFVLEAWSDDFGKWFVLDPLFNVYFRLIESGRPAGALEIRESLFGGEKIEAVSISQEAEPDSAELAAYYRNFAVSMRSDLMRHPVPLNNQDRLDMFLFYRDERTGRPYDKSVPYKNVTTRREDITYDCNKVRIEHSLRPGLVNLSFHTDGSMANFKEFMVKTNLSEQWRPSPWQRQIREDQGIRTLWVVPVNHYARDGTVNRVDILW